MGKEITRMANNRTLYQQRFNLTLHVMSSTGYRLMITPIKKPDWRDANSKYIVENPTQ